mmetsp:Transcript_33000/g.58066  ORF Transcript_33000/g.58066 Transcript_33000/m.58066 type:complete len:1253 (+) Transcript_33000:3188-6946(+)
MHLPNLNIEVKKPFTVTQRSDLYAQPRYPHVRLPKVGYVVAKKAVTHRYLVPLSMSSSLLNLPETYRAESRLSDVAIPEEHQESWTSTPLEEVPQRELVNEVKTSFIRPTLRDRMELTRVIETKSELSDTARHFGDSQLSAPQSPTLEERPIQKQSSAQLSTVRLVYSGQHSRSQPHIPEIKAALVRHKRLQTQPQKGDTDRDLTEPASPISPEHTERPKPKSEPKVEKDRKQFRVIKPEQDTAFSYSNLFEDREVLTSRSVENVTSIKKRTLLEEFIKKVISKHIRTEKEALTFIETQLNLGAIESRSGSRMSSINPKDTTNSFVLRKSASVSRAISASVDFRRNSLFFASEKGPRIQKAKSSQQLADFFEEDNDLRTRIFPGDSQYLSSPFLKPGSDRDDISMSIDIAADVSQIKPLSSASSQQSIRLRVRKSDSHLGEFDLIDIKPTVGDLVNIEVRDQDDSDEKEPSRSNSFSYSALSNEYKEFRSARNPRKSIITLNKLQNQSGTLDLDGPSTIERQGTISRQGSLESFKSGKESGQFGRRDSISKLTSPKSVIGGIRIQSPESIRSIPSVISPIGKDNIDTYGVPSVIPEYPTKETEKQSKKRIDLRVSVDSKESSRDPNRRSSDPKSSMLPRNREAPSPRQPISARPQDTAQQSLNDSETSSQVSPKQVERSPSRRHLEGTSSRGAKSRPRTNQRPPSEKSDISSRSKSNQPPVSPRVSEIEELLAPPQPEEVKQYVDKSSNSTDKFIINFARSLLKMISLRIIAKSPPPTIRPRNPDKFAEVAEQQKRANSQSRSKFLERMTQKQVRSQVKTDKEDSIEPIEESKDETDPKQAINAVKNPLGVMANKLNAPKLKEVKKLSFSNKQESYLKKESAIELMNKYAKPQNVKELKADLLSSDDESYRDDTDEYGDSRPSTGLESLTTPSVRKMHDMYNQVLNYEISKLSFMSRMANHILGEEEKADAAQAKNTLKPVTGRENLPETIRETEEPESANPDAHDQAKEDEVEHREIQEILSTLYEGPDVKSQLKLWFAEKQLAAMSMAFSQNIESKFSNQKEEADKPFSEEDLLKDGIDLKNLQAHTLRNYFYEMRKYQPNLFENVEYKDWKLYIMQSDHVSPLDKKMLRKDNHERRKLKMRRLSQILHDVKAITTMKRRPKKTFTNLDVPAVEKLLQSKSTGKLKPINEDVVLTGGANKVKSETERMERLYCRIKGEKNLQALGGQQARSTRDLAYGMSRLDNIMNSLW